MGREDLVDHEVQPDLMKSIYKGSRGIKTKYREAFIEEKLRGLFVYCVLTFLRNNDRMFVICSFTFSEQNDSCVLLLKTTRKDLDEVRWEIVQFQF